MPIFCKASFFTGLGAIVGLNIVYLVWRSEGVLKYLSIVMSVFISLTCYAEVDLSLYILTEEQTKIIRKLEAKKTVAEEVLLKLAQVSHNRNIKKKEFIPKHTLEQLEEIRQWAVGAVLRKYAEEVGLNFDYKTYLEEYPVYVNGKPYLAIFNFGFATGMQYYSIDIMVASINLETDLARVYLEAESKGQFIELLLGRAEKYKMAHLIE